VNQDGAKFDADVLATTGGAFGEADGPGVTDFDGVRDNVAVRVGV
jgi:hypothetical protein